MRLSWPEIRARAAAFAADWQTATYEKGETQSFYNAFFAMFGVERRRVGIFEQNVRKLDGRSGFIDLFWPGTLLVEQKSAGRSLAAARAQALDYINALPPSDQPKFLLLSDFQSFELVDLESREETAFALADLPRQVEKFGFILGRQVARFSDQDPVNIRAAELTGHLHDQIKASGYTGHKLEVFLTRIVFCLFADDTGIFEPKDMLWDYLESRTAPDGTDLGGKLADLFETLNTPEDQRQTTLDPDLARFPYVNGHLFQEYFPTPKFNAGMRAALVNACRFDWTPISPAIFGSLFQSVMEPAERRQQGAHYTTEQNILKLIGPLFLDDLRAEFARLQTLKTGRVARLRGFHDRLARLTFFDPACGCGNFLIIAYRELRRLELDLLKELRSDGQLDLDAAALSRIDVDQFFGIELSEFPARISATALWMMDHLMNRELSAAFGSYYPRIPLRKSPHIVNDDALKVDWTTVLPPERCSYLFGNPPFVGAKFQSVHQREQVRAIADLGKSGGTLDFVAAWFLKAGAYVQGPTRIAFVATNSITQGEQVAQLWPLLFDRFHLEIAFAHRTFAWGSDARGKAHVHVVIIGLDRRDNARDQRRLFSYAGAGSDPIETMHRAISPYLFDAGGLTNPHTVVQEVAQPINGMARIVIGSKPIDGGHFIFSRDEMRAFLAAEPEAARYFHPYVGSREFLQGSERFILYLGEAAPGDLRALRKVREVIANVRAYRLGEIPAKGKAGDSKSVPGMSSRQLARTPTLFHVTVVPKTPFLVLPEVSSERREYIPIAWLEPPIIPSNKVRILADATLTDFALLTSAMHVSWTRYVSGRLKSDFQYGIGVVYNTFPLPPGKETGRLAPLAQAVLEARSRYPGATLADLYDPDLMPPDLRAAHSALDRAVDRLYRAGGFGSDRERVEHLFALYEAMVAPLLPTRAKPRRAGRRRPDPA